MIHTRKDPTPGWRSARRLAVLAAVALVLAAVVLGGGEAHEAPPVEAVASAKPATRSTRWEPRESEPARGLVRPEVSGLSPLIDEVLVDRHEACTNELVMVSVRTRDDAPLPVRVAIDGKPGNPVPVSFSAPGERVLLVMAHGPRGQRDERHLPIQVRDCGDEFQYVKLSAERAASGDASDVYRFVAQPFYGRPACARDQGEARWRRCHAATEPGDRVVFHWDFGDGSALESDSGYVEHDYSDRHQDEVESRFLVKVEVRSEREGTLVGVTALTLENLSVANKQLFGVITPTAHAACEPRSDGEPLRCAVTFRNPDAATLTLEDVEITMSPCGSDEPSPSSHKAARRLLSTAVLPPGRSVADLELGARDIDGSACTVAFHARGIAPGVPGGLEVETSFGAVLRHAGPTAPVVLRRGDDDPEGRRRYVRTMRALAALGHRPGDGPITISDDEMRALELQGRMDP
jgi:hypothetical protein